MKFNKQQVLIYYQSIPAEIVRLGLTQQEVANLMGCSISGLTHRIKADKPQFHLAIYGLSNYLSKHSKRYSSSKEESNLIRHAS
jgi:predicted transcriptional regulator